MEIDMRRLTLHAALNKLIEGKDIADNVALAVDNMTSIYEEVDDIRLTNRERQETDWAKEAIKDRNLLKLGNFSVLVKNTRQQRTILFKNRDAGVEFVFDRTPKKAADRVPRILGRMAKVGNAEQNAMAEAFVTSAAFEGLGRNTSPNELLLGTSLALEDYTLRCVRKTVPLSGWLKFLPLERKVTIYTKPS